MAVRALPERTPSDSTRTPARQSAKLAAAIGVLLVLCIASLTLGARPLGLSTFVEALTDFDPANGGHAVLASRIPRTVAGLVVGAALAVAGAAMQGVARNPLADPGILGINAGAALAVVAGITIFGAGSPAGYLWFAFAGAGAAAAAVYSIAALGREGATPVKLALAGAVLAGGLSSLTNAVLVTQQETLDRFRFWQVGTLTGRGWDVIGAAAPFLAVALGLILCTGRLLNALALGDDVARGLGQNVALARGVTGLGIVVLCGGATAVAGPIAFVGLVVPHMVRLLIGGDYRWILSFSAVLGPVLLLGADIIGRVLLPPGEIQVGIMTALVGAPVFILLIRGRKAAGP